jgi:transcriptional regulator, araC family domain protein
MRAWFSYFLPFFLSLSLLGTHTYAKETRQIIDSIEKQLPHLSPPERLDALSVICDHAAYLNDAQYEHDCLRRLFREANNHDDIHLAGYAYANLMCSYYNYNMFDELLAELPKVLIYQERTGNEIYYFEVRELLIDMYLYQEKNYQALTEMQRMYDDAKKRKSRLGQAIALSKMGSAFGIIYRDFELATKSYAKAIEYFSQSNYISGKEINTYFEYAYLLYQLERWEELRSTTKLWKERLDKINAKREKEGSGNTLREYYLYFYSMQLIAEAEQKNFEVATKHFTTLKTTLTECPVDALPIIYDAFETYFTATGQYDSALYYNHKNTEISLAAGITANSTDALNARAAIFMQMQQYDSAARLYDRYIALCDSVKKDDNRELLSEFRTLSQVEELDATRRQFQAWLFFILAIVVLFGVFISLLIIYSRRLRKRNKILYAAIQNALLQRELVTAPTSIANANDEKLYQRLCRQMAEQTPYCDPKFDRDALVTLLNTNRNSLAEAIRLNEKGITIADYINQCRIKHAAKLIADYPQTQLADIAIVSGFNSNTTFNRLFVQHFGMSPAEYRDIALEYKRQ